MAWDNSKSYGSRAWRKLRAEILERDGHQCQLGLPGCTVEATEVDHIVGVAAMGVDRNSPAAHNPANLQASCHRCNMVKAGRQSAQARTKWKRQPETHPGLRW